MTEPHPREDLTGEDVARKLLILLRDAGYDVEREDLAVEPLLPAGLPDEPAPGWGSPRSRPTIRRRGVDPGKTWSPTTPTGTPPSL